MAPLLQEALQEHRWESETLHLKPGEHALSLLQSLLARPRCGVIFDDSLLYAWLCNVAPQEMLRVIARHRVMVVSEVLLPCEVLPSDLTVDMMRVPVRKTAQAMARSLASGGISRHRKRRNPSLQHGHGNQNQALHASDGIALIHRKSGGSSRACATSIFTSRFPGELVKDPCEVLTRLKSAFQSDLCDGKRGRFQ